MLHVGINVGREAHQRVVCQHVQMPREVLRVSQRGWPCFGRSDMSKKVDGLRWGCFTFTFSAVFFLVTRYTPVSFVWDTN
jgi:hypothetical protein